MSVRTKINKRYLYLGSGNYIRCGAGTIDEILLIHERFQKAAQFRIDFHGYIDTWTEPGCQVQEGQYTLRWVDRERYEKGDD